MKTSLEEITSNFNVPDIFRGQEMLHSVSELGLIPADLTFSTFCIRIVLTFLFQYCFL